MGLGGLLRQKQESFFQRMLHSKSDNTAHGNAIESLDESGNQADLCFNLLNNITEGQIGPWITFRLRIKRPRSSNLVPRLQIKLQLHRECGSSILGVSSIMV